MGEHIAAHTLRAVVGQVLHVGLVEEAIRLLVHVPSEAHQFIPS